MKTKLIYNCGKMFRHVEHGNYFVRCEKLYKKLNEIIRVNGEEVNCFNLEDSTFEYLDADKIAFPVISIEITY